MPPQKRRTVKRQEYGKRRTQKGEGKNAVKGGKWQKQSGRRQNGKIKEKSGKLME